MLLLGDDQRETIRVALDLIAQDRGIAGFDGIREGRGKPFAQFQTFGESVRAELFAGGRKQVFGEARLDFFDGTRAIGHVGQLRGCRERRLRSGILLRQFTESFRRTGEVACLFHLSGRGQRLGRLGFDFAQHLLRLFDGRVRLAVGNDRIQ